MHADRRDHAPQMPHTALPNFQNCCKAFVQKITSSNMNQAEDDSLTSHRQSADHPGCCDVSLSSAGLIKPMKQSLQIESSQLETGLHMSSCEDCLTDQPAEGVTELQALLIPPSFADGLQEKSPANEIASSNIRQAQSMESARHRYRWSCRFQGHAPSRHRASHSRPWKRPDRLFRLMHHSSCPRQIALVKPQ